MTNANLWELKQLLERASHEDRTNLERLIKAPFGNSPDKLCDHFQFILHGFFGQLVNKDDYRKFVTRVADHIQIDWSAILRGRQWHELPVADIEDAVVVTTFQRTFNQLPEEDRRRLAEQLGQQTDDPQFVGQLLSGGALLAANLSGFQIYLMATTAVGAVSGALGVALPFAIYTALTKSISIIIGPIGWAFLGLTVLLRLNQADWERLVPGIIYVSYIRHKRECE